MKSKSLLKLLSAGTLLLASSLAPTATAVTTDPVGYTTVEPTPSTNGTTRAFTVASFPLSDAPVFAGAATDVSTDTVTVSSATWGETEFEPSGTPSFVTHVLVPHSGDAIGKVFPILSNSSNTITVDLPDEITDLSTEIADLDSFRVVPVNTLKKIFGDPGVANTLISGWQKGTSTSTADVVYVWTSGGWFAYFVTTASPNRWRSQSSSTDVGNTPIYSDEPVWISRVSTGEMKLVIDGSVPVNGFAQLSVPGAVSPGGRQFTFVANPYPKDINLTDLNLLSLPGWLSGNITTADIVYVWTETAGGGWFGYFHNGTHWRSQSSSSSVDPIISANKGVWIARRSVTDANTDTFTSVEIPYTP